MQKSYTTPVNVCEVMSFVSAASKNLESDQGHMNIILILIYLSEDRGMSAYCCDDSFLHLFFKLQICSRYLLK